MDISNAHKKLNLEMEDNVCMLNTAFQNSLKLFFLCNLMQDYKPDYKPEG